jgi:hypothetical protein
VPNFRPEVSALIHGKKKPIVLIVHINKVGGTRNENGVNISMPFVSIIVKIAPTKPYMLISITFEKNVNTPPPLI